MPVLLCTTKNYSSTTPYYKVLRQYYSVLLQYYSVLQSTTPVLLCTTVLQSTTPVLLRTTKYHSSTSRYYKVLLCTTKYYSIRLQYYKVLLRTTKYYASTTQQFAPGATPLSDPKFAPEAIQKMRPKRPRALGFLGWCSQYVHLSSASPEAWKENFLIPQKSRNAFSMPVPMVAAQFVQHPWNSLPNTPHLQYRWAAKTGTSPLADDDAIQWMPSSGHYDGRLTRQYMIPHRLCYACYLLWAQYVSNCHVCCISGFF